MNFFQKKLKKSFVVDRRCNEANIQTPMRHINKRRLQRRRPMAPTTLVAVRVVAVRRQPCLRSDLPCRRPNVSKPRRPLHLPVAVLALVPVRWYLPPQTRRQHVGNRSPLRNNKYSLCVVHCNARLSLVCFFFVNRLRGRNIIARPAVLVTCRSKRCKRPSKPPRKSRPRPTIVRRSWPKPTTIHSRAASSCPIPTPMKRIRTLWASIAKMLPVKQPIKR